MDAAEADAAAIGGALDDRVDALAATAPGKTLEAAFKALIAHKDIAA